MMSTNKITVTWHGHACFSIDNGKMVLVLDPYKPEMIGYPPLKIKAHAMLASHEHEDHNYRKAVTFLPVSGEPVAYVPANQPWPDPEDSALFYVKIIDSYHDDAHGAKRGSNKIHIIRTGHLTLAHLGDLGHPLNEQNLRQLGEVDLMLIPVGGTYTINAEQAFKIIQQVKPKNIAPMHYQIGYGSLPIETADPFLDLIKEAYPVSDLKGPVLELSVAREGQCFLFRYQFS
jgi:L-ascorbate metabolism protein UlaG (beta-lactamase superfamily)